MERMFLKMLSIAALIAISGCTANPAHGGKDSSQPPVYEQKGMEISKTVSEMADTLYATMIADLKAIDSANGNGLVKKVTIPKVAVTSFVDTDTYENAGYLGRSMAEMFVHELDRRGIQVFEYKLTGSISITKDGEFVFSRNWKKVARQAMVRHILAGTITRNEKGIVVVGRIINMSNSTVVGSSTGFIPYERLPYCYRTGEKNCSMNGALSYQYYLPEGGKNVSNGAGVTDTVTSVRVSSYSYRSTLTPEQEKIAKKRKEEEFINNYYMSDKKDFNAKYYVEGAKVPGTSTGNYERYMYEKNKSSLGTSGKSSVVYPAQSYMYKDRITRDVHDESHYSRVSD